MLRTLQEASLKSRRVFLENHSFGKPERSRFAINQHKGRLHPRTHLQVCWRSASSRARELVFSWGSSLALEKTQMPKDSSEPVLESGPFCHLHHRALPPPCAGEQVSQQWLWNVCRLDLHTLQEESAPKRGGADWVGTGFSRYCLHPKLGIIWREAGSSPQTPGVTKWQRGIRKSISNPTVLPELAFPQVFLFPVGRMARFLKHTILCKFIQMFPCFSTTFGGKKERSSSQFLLDMSFQICSTECSGNRQWSKDFVFFTKENHQNRQDHLSYVVMTKQPPPHTHKTSKIKQTKPRFSVADNSKIHFPIVTTARATAPQVTLGPRHPCVGIAGGKERLKVCRGKELAADLGCPASPHVIG